MARLLLMTGFFQHMLAWLVVGISLRVTFGPSGPVPYMPRSRWNARVSSEGYTGEDDGMSSFEDDVVNDSTTGKSTLPRTEESLLLSISHPIILLESVDAVISMSQLSRVGCLLGGIIAPLMLFNAVLGVTGVSKPAKPKVRRMMALRESLTTSRRRREREHALQSTRGRLENKMRASSTATLVRQKHLV